MKVNQCWESEQLKLYALDMHTEKNNGFIMDRMDEGLFQSC